MTATASQNLAGKNVAIMLTRGVEQVELTSPMGALKDAGAHVDLVSPWTDGPLTAMNSDWDRGDTFEVDVPTSQAKADDYDLLVLPGGTLNADNLRLNADAVKLVKDFFAANKPVAAICHAPWILAQADLARGRRMTSYESIATDMQNAGADWVDEEVVKDGNLITSRNPGDLEAFDKAIVAALS